RFVTIGGGPAGNSAATTAARLGAEVTLVERDVVGGAAHLWDCIPSKAMIATGGEITGQRQAAGMGLRDVSAALDGEAVRARIAGIEDRLTTSVTELLDSQGVRILRGAGRVVGEHEVEVTDADGRVELIGADSIVLSTGSRPRIPDWAPIDGRRVLTTRDAYPPLDMTEHLVIVGS